MSCRRSGLYFAFINLLAILWGLHLPAFASQEPVAPKIPFPNPLEISQPDPLVPIAVFEKQRALSPLERSLLVETVEQLRQEGRDRYAQDAKADAFQVWLRELRLRQYLEVLPEIQALGRVGNVAWEERETSLVRVITERLQQLEQQLETTPSTGDDRLLLRQALGQSYEQVRATALAVNIYTRELERAEQIGDLRAQEIATTAMAELYFKDLNYGAAIAHYQDLLELVRQSPRSPDQALQTPRRSPTTHSLSQRFTPDDPIGQPLTELEVLSQLAYLFNNSQQFAEAIATNEAIIALYQQVGQLDPIPALKTTIAQHRASLNQTELALATWQEVYNLAIELKQYAYAADALQTLASHYHAQQQLDLALGLYQYLLDVQSRGDNAVGQMETLDQIGQIYLGLGNYEQARLIFQRGLVLAQQLSYRQDYFAQQIQQATPGQP